MKSGDTLDTIRTIIRARLPDPSYRVFLFGSRVTGRERKFSDVDIGIAGNRPVPARTLEDIREALEESDIPYTVDVVDFATTAPAFRNLALKYIQNL